MERRSLTVVVLTATALGCSNPAPKEAAKATPPVRVQNAVPEAGLATVRLTPQAEQRLGIRTAAVEYRKVARTRTFGGEVVVPAGHSIAVAAPIAGTLAAATGRAPAAGTTLRKGEAVFRLRPLLAPQRNLRTEAENEVAAAQARVDAAGSKVRRAEQVLRDKAGSVRAVEEAQAELAVAEAALKAAHARLEQVLRAPLDSEDFLIVESPQDGLVQQVRAVAGQTVAAGTLLFEVAALDPLWIRAPVYVGELAEVASERPARVHGLTEAEGGARQARPVAAPPSANADASSVDLYFEVANEDGKLRPGQRVGVTLELRGSEEGTTVPRAAVLYDVHGGAWVYENTAPQVFVRRRVEVRRIAEPYAVLSRGPAAGAKVVTVGAAELFGTEFGAGK